MTARAVDRVLDGLTVALAAAAPGLAFDRAFPLAVLGPAVGGAALLPLLTQGPGRPARLGRLVGLAGGLVLLFLALRSGAVGLLAITLPAPVRPDLLAVPLLLTLSGSAAGAVIAARLPPSARLVVLAPTAPGWVYGALLGPFTRLDQALGAAALLAVAAQLTRSTALSLRAVAGAAATLVAVAAATVAVAPAAVGAAGPRHRADPRAALATVGLPPSATNPIDWVDAWLTDPDRLLFTAETSRPVAFWRLAVLPGFDGRQWTPPARYTRAGLGVPPGDGATDGLVTQTVSVAALGGPFLPALDRPARIGAPVAAVDTATGVLLADPAARPGLRYTVVSTPPRPSADPGCAPGRPRPVPVELEAALDQLIAGACTGSFDAFAAVVQARLNTGRGNLARTPARGTSTGALLRFLAPAGAGTVVEFAAAFALAARRAGLDSRLVVGFAAAGSQVYARDVRLWVEVRAPGGGWSGYHPAPPPAVAPDTVATPPAAQPPDPPPPSPSIGDTPPPGGGTVSPRSAVRWWVLALAAAGLAAGGWISCLAAAGLARSMRRIRRRYLGDPRHRGLAAWHDTLDALARLPAAELDPTRLHTATPSSTARLLRPWCGGLEPELARLAATAGRCLFTERAPEPAAIADAWRTAAAVRRRLHPPLRVRQNRVRPSRAA